jgi:hypothetical protein
LAVEKKQVQLAGGSTPTGLLGMCWGCNTSLSCRTETKAVVLSDVIASVWPVSSEELLYLAPVRNWVDTRVDQG